MRDARFRIAPDVLSQSFFESHDRAYGYHNPQDPVEAVNLRLTAWGRLNHPKTGSDEIADGNPTPTETRPVYFNAETPDAAAVYHRADLLPGHRIAGPAVIEQLDSTALVYPGDTATVDAALNLIIELST